MCEAAPDYSVAKLEAMLATDPMSAREYDEQTDLDAAWVPRVDEEEERWEPEGPCDPGPPLPAFLVAGLAARVPSGQVVTELEMFQAEHADSYAVLEAMAAWKKVASMAEARVRQMASALAARPELRMARPRALAGQAFDGVLAGEEIAPRLGISRQYARKLVTSGQAMDSVCTPTGEALERGEIDAAKADLIVDAVIGLPGSLALAIQDEVLPKASGRTHYQVRQDLTKALAHTDPADFAVRHAVALKKRRVGRARPLPDGMASHYIVWDATDATALDLALDGAARSAKNDGDTRTLEQLRTDAMGLMVHSVLTVGHIGQAPDDAAPATASDHLGDQTESSTGDAAGGIAARVAAPVAAPVADASAPPPGAAFTPPPAPVPDLPEPPEWMRIGVLGGHRAEIRITIPLSTAMGGDEPAELDGYGPIPAGVARAIAAGGVWKRLVTDPLTNRVIDYGTSRYRPPQHMVDRVKANKPECVAPTCSRPAHLCELDHRIPFPLGHTSDENLDPQCRRDHLVRTHGGFHYVLIDDGVYEWTMPTGHRYRREADGTLVLLPRQTAPADDEPIPF